MNIHGSWFQYIECTYLGCVQIEVIYHWCGGSGVACALVNEGADCVGVDYAFHCAFSDDADDVRTLSFIIYF